MSSFRRISPLLAKRDGENQIIYLFFCPGCGHIHQIPFPRWNFNGDVDKPTFTPSLLIYYEKENENDPNTRIRVTVCHSTITDGKIFYHSDTPHALSGQTVDMVELKDGSWSS